jgi:hypothetical protein
LISFEEIISTSFSKAYCSILFLYKMCKIDFEDS